MFREKERSYTTIDSAIDSVVAFAAISMDLFVVLHRSLFL